MIGHPLAQVALFLGASALMIWRLEAMKGRGLEGTALGTLVMPYCSGLGNLVFVWIVARRGGPPEAALDNALVNNLTNLTLLLGLPALLWPMALRSGRRKPTKDQRAQRLHLQLTLVAGLFFCGLTWALASDGHLSQADGAVLVGLFLFWQAFGVYDVLKHNLRRNLPFHPMILVDLLLLGVGAGALYASTESLTAWLAARETGLLSARYLGLLTGWLMVIPNGILVFWYAFRGRPDIAYSSQIGDMHICIPLAVGVFAILHPADVPERLGLALAALAAAILIHSLTLSMRWGLDRVSGAVLVAAYPAILWSGWFAA